MNDKLQTLSGVPVDIFMREDWHVKPRLFRQAFPDFEPLCDIDTIFEMASDEDIESRLIRQQSGEWMLAHGPFEELPDLNQRNWTVLIQGLDLHLPEANELLQQFRFIPDARLDDIMLSLASDGGGVGPHYDSYDVFLIQMHGRRKWRIGPLNNATLLEDAPLKILENFEPEQEFVLEPGDMLYLPPNYGHEGQAVGVCSTLSVGFRALNKAELLSTLLRELADQVEQDKKLQTILFSDPRRGVQSDPSEIPADMIKFAQSVFDEFQPSSESLQKCLGIMLSEPKPNVYFENNTEDMQVEEIVETLNDRGLALSMGCRILFAGNQCFINGEQLKIESEETLRLMKELANSTEMEPEVATKALKNQEFRFFIVGFAKAGWLNTIY